MKQKFSLVISTLILINLMPAYSLSRLTGQWSLLGFGNYKTNFGISGSMNGTKNSVLSELATMEDYSKFPFADASLNTVSMGVQLSYRFPDSRFSPYFSTSITAFSVSNGIVYTRVASQDEFASLYVNNFVLGCEYTIGETEDLWNGFARLGILVSAISGEINYHGDYYTIYTSYRGGFESEVGGRVNIPQTPLSFEVSANYTNANILGKQRNRYIETSVQKNLNDAADPLNSNITAKTIDYLSLRFGLRLWF